MIGFGQERRLVTVLFADFVGFTALAEELDPEDLQEIVSVIFEALAEEAVRYDGTIEKFIGDAIFVIFGAPIAHEDDPQRALRTALAMQRVFSDHATRARKERGIELGLRIAVHTGMVVAGNVRPSTRTATDGRVKKAGGPAGELGVMGDTVNIASRLQSAATDGETFVTQATFRLTQREFSFREVGPIEIRGKEKPVLAYALTGERTDAYANIEVKAPLVGRWMELSRLDLAFQSAKVGRTEVVLITGEPGIGKSRLVSEFIGLAVGDEGTPKEDQPRVLRWTFSRVNQRSYAGFIEPLLVELGIDPTRQDSAVELEARLADLRFTLPAQSAPLLAQFLHLPGAKEPERESEEWKRSMYLVVYDTLASLARDRLLLIVLEDLHYADSASLDLLWFVASRASRVPILILLAQRPGAGVTESRLWRTNFTQLILEPLPDDEAARIVESTFEQVPAELRDKIVARAGGNPFFIEESIRSLIESGAISRDEHGEWLMRGRVAALEVPATLHAVIAARIDRLPPLARECLQLASVIGQRFGDRVLRIAGGDALGDAVDTLIAADLVLEAAPGERREGRFRFKHAVTQEVAYNTLLVRRRVELHRKVAEAYEVALGDQVRDFYPALSHHYLLAEVNDKAASYAWKAALRAVSIHANVEALRFAELALELYEKLGLIEQSVEALSLIGRVRRYRGEHDAALAAYERAVGLLEARAAESAEPESLSIQGSVSPIATLYARMAELCTRWDAKHPDVEGLIEKGLRLVGEGTSRERIRLLAARAFAPRRSTNATDADWERSLLTAREALTMAEELGLLREVSLSLDAVGYAYRELGQFREAYQYHQRRIPIAQSLQDSDELIDAHSMIAVSAAVLGDMHESIEHAETARQIAQRTDKPTLGMAAVQMECTANLFAGNFAAVMALVAIAEQFAAPKGSVLAMGMGAAAALASPDEKGFRDRLVEIEATPRLLAAADFLAAHYGQRDAKSAYQGARAAEFPGSIIDRTLAGPLMVLAAARCGVEDEPFETSIANVVERSGHARGRAFLTQARGLRAADQGDRNLSENLLLDAMQAFATLRLDYERAVAMSDHARALQSLGRTREATDEMAEAKEIAERISASALRSALESQPLTA